MIALNQAIATYAAHAQMTVADVQAGIASGNERICNTIAVLRLRFESSAA